MSELTVAGVPEQDVELREAASHGAEGLERRRAETPRPSPPRRHGQVHKAAEFDPNASGSLEA